MAAADRYRLGGFAVLTLTRKTEYALVAMADLARLGTSTVTAADMAKRLRMPLPALRQILTRLMHRELAVSTRGVQGGYRLGRPPDKITLAEVIDAVEGPFSFTRCSGDGRDWYRQECCVGEACPISESVRKVQNLLERCLSEVTVADLAFGTVPAVSVLTVNSEKTDGKAPAASE